MPKPGELLAGRYRVERTLGSGGMGLVLAAHDEETGDHVALKLLHNVSDTKSIDRFFREARTMGQLESDHVVRVRDSGHTDDKTPYLVMDRLEGHDLAQRAKKGPLPVGEAADVVIQACEALSHAHAKGIVHRDVKPSNLFLHREGSRTVVKMLDFGISKILARDVWERTLTATADGGVLGSPPYMSPEQVRDPRAVDSRSDVWSLGVLLYRLLSGAVPFDGESVGEVFAKILERPVPSIRVTTDVPQAIDEIIASCLVKDRDLRCQHVGELALALAPFASKEIAALAPSIAQRMHDEMPTLDKKSAGQGVAVVGGAPKNEPRTLTVGGPPVARASSIPPPPAMAASIATGPEAMKVTSVTPPPMASGADSVSLDVEPPRKSRAWLAVLLATIGIAGGLAIGLSVRGDRGAANAGGGATATAPAAVTATGAAPAAATAAATATVTEPVTASATATATATVATSGAPPTTAAHGGRRGGRKTGPTPPAGTATTAAAPPSTAPTTPPAARPELQPSPYPTP